MVAIFQEAASRKNQVVVTIKEIQMRPRTDQHDFETKMKHARRFLLEGDKKEDQDHANQKHY